jgi:hypothetical protein
VRSPAPCGVKGGCEIATQAAVGRGPGGAEKGGDGLEDRRTALIGRALAAPPTSRRSRRRPARVPEWPAGKHRAHQGRPGDPRPLAGGQPTAGERRPRTGFPVQGRSGLSVIARSRVRCSPSGSCGVTGCRPADRELRNPCRTGVYPLHCAGQPIAAAAQITRCRATYAAAEGGVRES